MAASITNSSLVHRIGYCYQAARVYHHRGMTRRPAWQPVACNTPKHNSTPWATHRISVARRLNRTNNRMNATTNATPVHCQDCGLSKLCFPPSFDQQMLEEVAHAVGQIPVLPKGGVVYARGDAASALYAVRSGAVKTIIVDAQGEEQVTGFYLPGEVVGLEHLGQAQCITTAVALERSMLCALPITSMSQL